MSDQRRDSRIPIRQRIWCEGEHLTLYVQALNVSTGGLFVRTAAPPSPGECFRVSFPDMEEGEIVAQVEVVWARRVEGKRQSGMGLRIVTFEKGAANYQHFLERKERDAREADAGDSFT